MIAARLSIDQRLYRGDIDTPKTHSSTRTVAIPPKTANQLREWMELVGREARSMGIRFGEPSHADVEG